MTRSRKLYSSSAGRICPNCGKPKAHCICAQMKEASRPKGDGIVRVGRETKGRKGSGVSVITGLPLRDADLKALAKRLKQKCGAGGAVKDGTIEIQGDHRDLLVTELTKLGYTVKKVGG